MKIRIEKPCDEIWDEMQPVPEGKFCEKCKQKVFDFSGNTTAGVFERNTSKICGKISNKKPLLSGILIAFSLSTSVLGNAQKLENKTALENVHQNYVTITGTLLSKEKRELISGEISLVTLDKIYAAKADEKGNFSLTFPEKALSEYNVIRIDYTITDFNGKKFTDYKSSIFTTKELLGQKDFQIEEEFFTIGAVVIVNPPPPDFYFFDGKKIGKRKFEKLKQDNPDYQSIIFYDDVIVQKLTGKTFVNNLYLLYSK